MGHYDEFYEAKYERERKAREAREKREDAKPLSASVEAVEFYRDKAVVTLHVPYYGEERQQRILKIIGTAQQLEERT